MANEEHLEILKQGIKQWNRWRKQHREIHPDLSDINLRHSNLRYAYVAGANLSFANLSKADLRDTHLYRADLNNADLSYANLIDVNLNCANLRNANLSGADLSATSLSNADLSEAELTAANLSGADLSDANLRMANLSDANLSSTRLTGTDLSYTNLSDANLSGADLGFAILNYADLSGANLNHTIVSETMFAKTDLCEVIGLAELNHTGSSRIELHTIQLPQDGSSLHFLRGAGVPEEWIYFYQSNMMHPIQYHSCFISYSSSDDIVARRLHADLQAQGVRCWFSPEDMKIGDKIRARIDEAIHLQDKLLLLLSEHAIASAWVEGEVEAALEKEQHQQREVLFPVRLDDAVIQTNQAWAKQLRRTRHIGDFTRWTDPQAYGQVFERLLRDLKA